MNFVYNNIKIPELFLFWGFRNEERGLKWHTIFSPININLENAIFLRCCYFFYSVKLIGILCFHKLSFMVGERSWWRSWRRSLTDSSPFCILFFSPFSSFLLFLNMQGRDATPDTAGILLAVLYLVQLVKFCNRNALENTFLISKRANKTGESVTRSRIFSRKFP